MSEDGIKYCFYCGIKLDREAKYCASCGTHLDEEPSFKIKETESKQETSSTTQSENPEPIHDEFNSVSLTTQSGGIGLGVGAALLMGHRHRARIHRRMLRHRRKLRRARMMQRRMLRNARMMRRRI